MGKVLKALLASSLLVFVSGCGEDDEKDAPVVDGYWQIYQSCGALEEGDEVTCTDYSRKLISSRVRIDATGKLNMIEKSEISEGCQIEGSNFICFDQVMGQVKKVGSSEFYLDLNIFNGITVKFRQIDALWYNAGVEHYNYMKDVLETHIFGMAAAGTQLELVNVQHKNIYDDGEVDEYEQDPNQIPDSSEYKDGDGNTITEHYPKMVEFLEKEGMVRINHDFVTRYEFDLVEDFGGEEVLQIGIRLSVDQNGKLDDFTTALGEIRMNADDSNVIDFRSYHTTMKSGDGDDWVEGRGATTHSYQSLN